ncbi:hemin uptake protein HemP [Azoarcus sp. L1K30]|nr:hemin uptake protein HemP [Azoarcus sp. L1K30]
MSIPPLPETFLSGTESAGREQEQSNAGTDAISSAALLGGRNSVTINHEGVTYYLRATRSGKLILTK